MLEEYHLEFHSLAMAEPHVFLRAAHPLAKRSSVTTADLEPYPFLCFEQGVHNSFYFAEELLSTVPHKRAFASATVRHCSTCSAESTATPFAAVWSVPT